ncbi:MAG: hypothetical protein LUC93_17670 [Planctomycetaceae bacterium]|nr:hypothetical protein [Planctomycetaceae bacterium]
MKVPNIQGGNQAMRGPGRVQVGNYANASHFGADKARDLAGIGSAIQKAGAAVLDEAQNRQFKEDKSFVRDQISQARLAYLEKSQDIFKRQGKDADTAPQDMATLLETMKKDHDKALGDNKNRREMFESAWSQLARQGDEEALAHRLTQMDVYDQETLDGQNAAATVEAGKRVVQPGGIDAVLADPYTEIIKRNIAERHKGQPPEVVALRQTEALKTFHLEQLKNLGAVGPDAVLDYLGRDAVKDTFSPAEYKALHADFDKALRDKQDSDRAKQLDLDAMTDARAGMSENDAREAYLSDPNLSDKDVEAKLNTFKAARTAEKSGKVADRSDRENQLRDAYAEAGFIPSAIPDDLKVTARERAELIKWGNTFTENGGKDSPPDVSYLMRLDALSQGELQDILLDEEKAEEFYNKVGGHKSQYAKDFIEKARGNKGDKRPLTDTNEGWAADRFATDNGLVFGSARDAETINDFVAVYKPLAEQRARELGLNKADDLPVMERAAIYGRLMMTHQYDKHPTLKKAPLIGSFFAPDERRYYEILQDEEAEIEMYLDEDTEPPAGVTYVSGWEEERLYGSQSKPPTQESPDTAAESVVASNEFPEVINLKLGHKGNVVKEWVTGDDGKRYVKVTESGNGKFIAFFDDNGKQVKKEKVHAR